VSTASPEIDEIRRQMAQIRRDLHKDVQNVVEGAEAVTDWRRFVRNYPWACMGAALAIGFMIVPRKQRPTTALQVAPAEIARVATIEPSAPLETEKKGKGLLGTVFGFVVPIALRAAQGYALQFAEQWMSQKVAEQMQQHPDLAAAFGSHPSEPRGPQVSPPGSTRF
jgi:hypothetical protein